jgi:hypothetical protein
MRKIVDDDVEETGADASQEVITQKAIASPDQFHFASKHPESEHVEKDVPDVTDFMKKKVSEWLPDAEAGKHSGGNQAKFRDKPLVTQDAAIFVDEGFQNEDGEIRDEKQLHRWRHIEVKRDAVRANSGAGCH